MKRLWLRRVLLVLALVIVLVGAGFVVWAEAAAKPMPEVDAALVPGNGVDVSQTAGWLIFRPQSGQTTIGLVFYPGGRVEPGAYAPAAREIAQQGYLVVIAPMPLNLAVFDYQRASEVIAAFPNVQAWAVGGHSLGGAMAAQYAYANPGAVKGLVLWAAYPAESSSLADRDLKVVSVHGSQDGLATPEKIEASRSLLPAGTTYVLVEGGNHAQFGWYGDQAGDGAPSISREEQQRQVVEATVKLLSALESQP